MDLPYAKDIRPIYVFDGPRTCSQLFNKMFVVHPQLHHVFHPLMGASVYGPERVSLRMRHCSAAEEAHQALAKQINLPEETYEVAAARLAENTSAIVREAKIPFIKDHIYCVLRPELIQASLRHGLSRDLPMEQIPGNPTMLHTDFFGSAVPVIVIRHPALIVPSFYRAEKDVFSLVPEDEDFAAMTTLKWARIVFDAYTRLWAKNPADSKDNSETKRYPIVIDAADVVYKTEKLMPELCRELGIDDAGIQYQWDPVPDKDRPADPVMQGFFKDVLRSDGVRKAASGPAEKDINLDTMISEWAKEFGKEDAQVLYQRVEEELLNYAYLSQFKMKIEGMPVA